MPFEYRNDLKLLLLVVRISDGFIFIKVFLIINRFFHSIGMTVFKFLLWIIQQSLIVNGLIGGLSLWSHDLVREQREHNARNTTRAVQCSCLFAFRGRKRKQRKMSRTSAYVPKALQGGSRERREDKRFYHESHESTRIRII